METLNNELFKSLSIYFDALSKLGYIKYSEVNKLIVVLFIKEILDELFDVVLSDKDFRSITNALNCLYGCSCILSYPDMKRGLSIRVPLQSLFIRTTEQNMLRSAEVSKLRSTE